MSCNSVDSEWYLNREAKNSDVLDIDVMDEEILRRNVE